MDLSVRLFSVIKSWAKVANPNQNPIRDNTSTVRQTFKTALATISLHNKRGSEEAESKSS